MWHDLRASHCVCLAVLFFFVPRDTGLTCYSLSSGTFVGVSILHHAERSVVRHKSSPCFYVFNPRTTIPLLDVAFNVIPLRISWNRTVTKPLYTTHPASSAFWRLLTGCEFLPVLFENAPDLSSRVKSRDAPPYPLPSYCIKFLQGIPSPSSKL